jgi:hypothetical protein
MKTYRPKLGPLLLQPNLYQQQAGFIQAALLFGIALMTAILGGFALANRSPSSQTDTEQAKVNASVILKQGSDLRDGAQRFATDNGSDAISSTMNFTDDASSGLFEVAARYASPQIMPTSAFVTALVPSNVLPSAVTASDTTQHAGHWFLNKGTAGNGLGTSDEDPMVVLPGLREEVCSRINRLLYGSSTIPTATGAMTAFTVMASDGGISGVAAVSGWPEGCVITSDSRYVYFKVIQEN